SITDYQIIVERVGRVGFDGGYSFLLRAGQIHFRSFKNGSEMDELVSASTVSTGQWYHTAGVFDGSQMRLYLNGLLDASKSSTFAPSTGTDNLYLGYSGQYACFPFNGRIEEVRLS